MAEKDCVDAYRQECVQLRARIAELEKDLAHWQHCHGVAADRIVQLEYENESIKRGQSQVALLTTMNEKHIERLTAENQRLRADKELVLLTVNQALVALEDFRNRETSKRVAIARDLLRSAIDAAKSREG